MKSNIINFNDNLLMIARGEDVKSDSDNRKLKFSLFTSQYDMIPQPLTYHWWEIVELLTTHNVFDGDKTNAYHFNGCEFHTPNRRQSNVEAMHMLVLDYDDGLPLEEARALFSQYEHICYTSYNHQVPKAGKDPVDKYRIVLPLKNAVQMDDWMEIRHNVETFAPMVDMASVRLHQPFAIPLVRKGRTAVSWHNKGQWLNVSDWERVKVTDDFGQYTANPLLHSDKILKPDDVLNTKKGTIRVGDVTGHVGGVLCPFHNDKSPGEFLSKSPKGNIFLSCHKCGTVYMEEEKEEDDFSVENWLEKRKVKKPEQPLVVIDDHPVEPFSRKKRAELLKKRCLKPRKRMLLYAFEGFGKSYLTNLWANEGRKVIFGCDSNMQAQEQADSFKKAGCNVQLIVSREYRLITEHGVVIENYEPSHPWDDGKVNKDKTINNMVELNKMSEDDALELWNELEAPKPDTTTFDIIVTTHSRIQGWGMVNDKANYFKEDAIIVYDDPSKSDFMRLKDFDNKFADTMIDGKPIARTTCGKREYFVRPDKFMRGFGFNDQYLVFTTTELITSYLIENNYDDVYKPKLMPDQKLLAGSIHLMKTELVRAKFDGILPPIIERVKKEGHNVEYFADGQGNQYNLKNNKGQNIFIDTNTIIEISQPHLSDVILTCNELGWGDEYYNLVKLIIALDQVHQAIGRNSGYRWSDIEDHKRMSCVVLCEPQLHNDMVKYMRYAVETVKDLDAYETGFRLRERDSLLNCIIWLIQNYRTYVCDGLDRYNKQFVADVKSCLSSIPKRNVAARKKRLLNALQTMHKKSNSRHKIRLVQLIDQIAVL